MEVITPKTLANALKDFIKEFTDAAEKDFKERGDARWIDDSELEDKAKDIVDEYLEDAAGLSNDDIADILGQ